MSSSVLDAFAALGDALDAVRKAVEGHLHEVGDGELIELLRIHHRSGAQLDALGLDLVSDAGARDLPHRCGASSPSAWLSGLLKLSPHTAAQRVRTAAALELRCPWTYDQLASGEIAFEQAAAITAIVSDLPKGATEQQAAKAERYLLDRAPTSNALELRKLHKRVEDLIDPDGLLTRERTAQKKRDLGVRDNHDGTQTVRWTDTDERIAKFKAALNPLAAPQPAADGTKDPRTPGQRRADAMADLVERALRFGDLPTTRGHRAHIIVTITAENLRTETGFGTTTTGETLTAEAIRRIACDAELHPLHIDGHGIPLKLGRSQRLASPAQWLALIARDGGCIGPSCTRPPEWTQAHHIEYWEHLGPTDLENLCLLCDFHHDQVHRRLRRAKREREERAFSIPSRLKPVDESSEEHHGGWDIQIADDGHPELIPPERVDPLQRPIRNLHWRGERGAHTSPRAA